jgi:hypothetical protein
VQAAANFSVSWAHWSKSARSSEFIRTPAGKSRSNSSTAIGCVAWLAGAAARLAVWFCRAGGTAAGLTGEGGVVAVTRLARLPPDNW